MEDGDDGPIWSESIEALSKAAHFESNDHALATGYIIGLLSNDARIEVLAVLDAEDNYINQISVHLFGRDFTLTITEDQ